MIVNLFDFIPPARSDGIPWNAWFLEEAPDVAGIPGSWTQIDTAALTPLDADPRYPAPRDITSDNATGPNMWYRVRFRDQNNEFSEYTDPLQNTPKRWIPTLRNVAVHIRARTVTRQGAFVGTFTDKTRPNDDEAWEAIWQAEKDVYAATGRLDKAGITNETQDAARAVVALRAAMLIERSYYPEQVGTNKSPYPGLKDDFEARLAQLVEAVAEDLAGDVIPGEEATDGSGPVATDSDHVVPSGSRVLSKTGTWVGEGEAQFTFSDDQGGMISWETQF